MIPPPIRRGAKVILKTLQGQEDSDIPARAVLDEDADGGVLVAVIPPVKGTPNLVVYVEAGRIVRCDETRWQAQVDTFYAAVAGQKKG